MYSHCVKSAKAEGVVLVPRSWVWVWPEMVGVEKDASNCGAYWVSWFE